MTSSSWKCRRANYRKRKTKSAISCRMWPSWTWRWWSTSASGTTGTRRTSALVDLRPRALHHFTPARRIAADRVGEFLGRAAGGLIADDSEALPEHRRADRFDHCRIQPVQHRARNSRGRDDPRPGPRLVAEDARLRDRRQLGKG